jgi:hypothetical protein
MGQRFKENCLIKLWDFLLDEDDNEYLSKTMPPKPGAPILVKVYLRYED